MAAMVQPPRTAPQAANRDLGDLLSWLAEELGIGWGLALGLVLPTAIVLAVGAAGAVWLWRRTGHAPSETTGTGVFAGRVVTLRSAEGTRGQVFVEGSWWSVRSTGAPLHPGDEVLVREVDRLDLVVEPHAGRTGGERHETSDEEET